MGENKVIKNMKKATDKVADLCRTFVKVTPEIRDRYRVPTYQVIM